MEFGSAPSTLSADEITVTDEIWTEYIVYDAVPAIPAAGPGSIVMLVLALGGLLLTSRQDRNGGIP